MQWFVVEDGEHMLAFSGPFFPERACFCVASSSIQMFACVWACRSQPPLCLCALFAQRNACTSAQTHSLILLPSFTALCQWATKKSGLPALSLSVQQQMKSRLINHTQCHRSQPFSVLLPIADHRTTLHLSLLCDRLHSRLQVGRQKGVGEFAFSLQS